MERILETALQLRQKLHNCAELSGQEVITRATLIAFLKEHTSLEIHDCGPGFYAVHREPGAGKPSIALRADYDALPAPGGGAAHLCGHDGHSAGLCAVGMMLEGKTLNRDVFLLFQPAEETGAGALQCLGLFDQEHVDLIFGLHNRPGMPAGHVLVNYGSAACASLGLIIRYTGRPAHAAYPEGGISPAAAVGELLSALPELTDPQRYEGMTMATVIGCRMGEKAFGKAASDAEVWLTLRGEYERDFEQLTEDIRHKAEELADRYHLAYCDELQDVFPATENHAAAVDMVMQACGAAEAEEPMRASEDFGHFLMRCPGALFWVGSGEDHPNLHDAAYEYPDEILPASVQAFWNLLTF
ncbi:MAG: M20/M25/M40 family metallo-hydrolase [Solobacterium sp.]|nr:M20/M25/M40 family metallo-hydrolase [Solobacterium sp.]